MNTENENIELIIAEPIVVNSQTITDVQLIDREWDNDDETAMSMLLNMMDYFSMYAENCEEFMLPNADGELPYIELLEMMKDMLNSDWGKRTTDRMRREIAGIPRKTKLTQAEKAENPDYRFCDVCSDYFHKDYLKHHTETKKHREKEIERSLRRTDDKVKMVSGQFVFKVKKVFDGLDRIFANRKINEPELEEEKIDAEDINEKEEA